MGKNEEQKKRFTTVDDTIDDFMEELSDFHSTISRFAIKNSDVDLELAINRIAEAMTSLNKRSRSREEAGTHGKEKK